MRHLKVLHITIKITVVCDATADNIPVITYVSEELSVSLFRVKDTTNIILV